MLIYHIADETEWQRSIEDGEYRISTRGRTLAEQGYIHASDAHQVALVANAVYPSDENLVVLVIDADRLRSEVRYEHAPDASGSFPHIYGPLNVDAVVRTVPLECGPDGRYAFTG